MGQGISAELLWAALVSGLLAFPFVFRQLKTLPALFVILVKLGFAAIYFGYYDGTWYLTDDWDYLERSQDLLDRYTLWELLTTEDGIRELFIQAQGHHTLYYVWNIAAQLLFGNHYYAPVFLNITLTFVGGFFFYQIVLFADFGKAYARLALMFFLLHWDLLAWSSFFNLKDILVMTMTTMGLYALCRILFAFRWRDLVLFCVVLVLFFWIRFYVAFFMLAVAGMWYFLKIKSWRKWPMLFAIAAGMVYLLPDQSLVHDLDFTQFITGLVRFPITPQPWSITPVYGFLFLPSIMHWLLILPALYGGILLWRRSPVASLLLLYALVLWSFYAAFPGLQGPRHRVQITFVIAWMQFHFLWLLIRSTVRQARYSPT